MSLQPEDFRSTSATLPDRNDDLDRLLLVMRELRGVLHLDHSVSIPHLGSPFIRDRTSTDGIQRFMNTVALIRGVHDVWPGANGTTALNNLAVATVAHPGDRVLCDRQSHASLYAAMIRLGLQPSYVCPDYDPALGIAPGISPATLEEALNRASFSAVFLTYPAYFGSGPDIRELVSVAKAHFGPTGGPPAVVVDEAHGAYLHFHPDLPAPAETSEADIVVMSTHKTLGALSQGSLALLCNPKFVERWYECVNALGDVSTSFSYPILTSVDLAEFQMVIQGRELLERAIALAVRLRSEIEDLGLTCLGLPKPSLPSFAVLDPLRVAVDISATGMSGYAVEAELAHRFGIYAEMATVRYVLFLLTPFDGADPLLRGDVVGNIAGGLASLVREHGLDHAAAAMPAPPRVPAYAVSPRDAFFARTRVRVPVAQAVGRVSAETIGCYPPGSSIVVAGEVITAEVVDYLSKMRGIGATLKGATDADFDTILTVQEV